MVSGGLSLVRVHHVREGKMAIQLIGTESIIIEFNSDHVAY